MKYMKMEKVVPRLAVTFWRKKRFEDFVIPNKQTLCPSPGPPPPAIYVPGHVGGIFLWDRTQRKLSYLQGNIIVWSWLNLGVIKIITWWTLKALWENYSLAMLQVNIWKIFNFLQWHSLKGVPVLHMNYIIIALSWEVAISVVILQWTEAN